jgi:polyhydroxyalkanoate synthase
MTTPLIPDPMRAMAEFSDLNVKLVRGAELLNRIRDDDVQIATTPKREVWRQDKTTLYRYEPLAERAIAVPVLMVYGLVGRYTMADLQEDRSLVRNLLHTGVDLYAVDWDHPTRADRWLTLEDDIGDSGESFFLSQTADADL